MTTPFDWNVVWLSLKVSSIAAWVCLIPAAGVGWVLARKQFRGKLWLENVVNAPLVLPPVITGYLLLVLFGTNGVAGKWLYNQLGIRLVFSWYGAAVAAAVIAFPLAVRSIRIAFEMVDPKLEEAAATLGFHPFRVFMKLTLPLALPGVVAGYLLAFARSLGEFGATITFAGNVEGVTQTLPLAVYTALQVPGGERHVVLLVLCSLALSLLSLSAATWLDRKLSLRRTRGQT